MALIEEISYDGVLQDMESTFAAEAGFTPGEASDIGIRLRVLATQIDSVASSGRWLLKQMFFTTASGEYLDMHAQMKGLSRNSGGKASGALLFSLSTALTYDVTIPAGTVCTTAGSDPVRFVVTQSGTISAGSTGLTLAAEAESAGISGNVLAGTVTVIVSPPAVGMKVSNTYAFKYGTDDEDDDTLRERIRTLTAYPSNGTNAAYYMAEALKLDSVQSAAVVPRAGGRGKVAVYIAGAGQTADTDTVNALSERLNSAREINVDVTVYPAVTKSISVTMGLHPKDGYTFAGVKTQCASIISDYFAGLVIGEDFSINRLGKKLLCECEGLADYTFTNPTVNQSVGDQQLAVSGTISLNEWSA